MRKLINKVAGAKAIFVITLGLLLACAGRAATFVQTRSFSVNLTSTLNTGTTPAVNVSTLEFAPLGPGWQIQSILLTIDGIHSGNGFALNNTSNTLNPVLTGTLTSRVSSLTASAAATTSHVSVFTVPGPFGSTNFSLNTRTATGTTVALQPSEYAAFLGVTPVPLVLNISATASTTTPSQQIGGLITWSSVGTARLTITALPSDRGGGSRK